MRGLELLRPEEAVSGDLRVKQGPDGAPGHPLPEPPCEVVAPGQDQARRLELVLDRPVRLVEGLQVAHLFHGQLLDATALPNGVGFRCLSSHNEFILFFRFMI